MEKKFAMRASMSVENIKKWSTARRRTFSYYRISFPKPEGTFPKSELFRNQGELLHIIVPTSFPKPYSEKNLSLFLVNFFSSENYIKKMIFFV